MNLKERMQAEETRIGKFLVYIVGYLGLVLTAVGEGLTYMNVIPHDWIPQWLRVTIAASAIAGGILGKLTVKKQK